MYSVLHDSVLSVVYYHYVLMMDTYLIFHLCIHRGEAMYISVIDSIYFAHKDMVFGSLAIHQLIMITCISYEIIFTTISLPKLINIAPL